MAKLLGESAVRTVSGVPIGTPLYMSPEQARGEKVDGRSDVYAFGVVCHEMLTGQLPFTGDSPLAVLMCHLSVAPPRVSEVCDDLPSALDEPISRMLHKEPSGRPATAGEGLRALVLAAESAGYSIPSGLPRLPEPEPAAAPRPSFSPIVDTPGGADTQMAMPASAAPAAAFAEQLIVQYYTERGIFEDEVRIASSAETGWVPRSEAGEHRLWFIARDDRGGVSWQERRVRVR